MLTSKWNTLNRNCQKFNAIFKRCKRVKKSGKNDLDVMKRVRKTYRDENKGKSFTQEGAWDILKTHCNWDAPSPVDITGSEQDHTPGGGHEELFDEDSRPRPPGKARPAKNNKSETTTCTEESNSSNPFGDMMSAEFRLKREVAKSAYEVAKDKDRTVMRLEEMKFLAISTKDLSEGDAYWTNVQNNKSKTNIICVAISH
ncbi:hypothetical protein Tco_1139089 [Tanacetum coccineum]